MTGIEYEFQGLPKTLPAGNVAIKFTDTGAEFHELGIARIKSKDSVKKILGLSEKEQAKKIEEIGGTFAMQGQTTYTIADLSKPGRYGVVCFLPVGSTSEQAAEQAEKKHAKAHWQEGMLRHDHRRGRRNDDDRSRLAQLADRGVDRVGEAAPAGRIARS